MPRRALRLWSALLLLASPALPAWGADGPLAPLPPQPAGVPWPTEAWPEAAPGPGVDAARLAAAVRGAFEPSAAESGRPDETRALLVVHRGAIVAERYARGCDRTTRFLSWSMAKSVTQALVGVLVREGRLSLDAPASIPEWRRPGDPRGALTLRQLLHMTSGLDAEDDDVSRPASSHLLWMLFGGGAYDVARYAASFPLAHPPDTHWAYSTATSMLVASIVGRAAGGERAATLAFMRRELFDPLGMHSAVPEFDAAGTFLGGGFVWMTARDWARFGMLYLRDGRWGSGAQARRILPEGWVDFSRTRAPAPDNTQFGAYFWRNVEPAGGQFTRLAPGSPESLFMAEGAYGQLVVMSPTRDLVIVRLGDLRTFDFVPLAPLVDEIVASFPSRAGPRTR